ncbi:hypothetical protein G9A89_009626 [Geosiphon pyriformis]|nr:hypothetical protein G9A89_009626 [Geosiphon pyriformis]
MAESSMGFDDEETVDPCCMGCCLIIEEGNVVAFGEGIWHVQCFRCAKCHNLVEHDSNLLLLSDGNPICENCSYNCHVCKKPILDEAIMTGDESFHVECFRCRQCHRKIDDLVFAKTSQGICCMSCHNERVNRVRRAKEKEKENSVLIPQTSFEKSLPSLPQERKRNNLQLPSRSVNPKRSFERPANPSKITPKTSAENITKPHTLPPSGPGIARRQSRIFDASSFGDVFKNKVTTPASKAFEQLTTKPGNMRNDHSDKYKTRGDPSESSKRAGFFSRRNESVDNFSRIMPSRNREDIPETHSRNSSIASFRSEPSYDTSGRSFSLSSQRSDLSDSFSKNHTLVSNHPNDRNQGDIINRKIGSSSHRKTKSPNFIHHAVQHSLPNIEENFPAFESNSNGISHETTPTQRSPTQQSPTHSSPRSRSPSPSSPRSASPPTPPSTSPTSPPSSTTDGFEVLSYIANPNTSSSIEAGPPLLPPLSFTNSDDDDDDELSKLLANVKLDRSFSTRNKKRRSRIVSSDEKASVSNKVKECDDKTSDSSPLSTPKSDRKNSDSSINSSGRESLVPTVTIEYDNSEVGELKQELILSQKNLAEAENKLRKIKRVSQLAFDEYNEEYDKEVTLRKEAESNVDKLRVQLALQSRQMSALAKEKEEMVQMVKDSKLVKQELEEMKQGLKELNVQKELVIKEIEGLVKEKQAGLGSLPSSKDSHRDLPVSLARHISTHLDQVKQGYLSDIILLQSQRDALKQETDQLLSIRDQYIEEAQNLNAKNLELAELNNELTRQIDTNSRVKTNHNGFNFFRGNKTSITTGYSESNNAVQAPFNSPGHSPGGSVHSLDPQNNEVTHQVSMTKLVQRNSISRAEAPKKFKWKKFNKLLSTNNNPITDHKTNTNTNGVISPLNSLSKPSPPNSLDNRSEVRSEGRTDLSHKKMASLGVLNQEQKKASNESSSPRAHNWQQTSFLRPIKCEHCQEKMWGLTETRCSVCGVCSHTKCSTLINTNCLGTPDINADNDFDSIINLTTASMFGNDLVKQLELEGRIVPYLVQKCIKAVEARGMDFEGIYRKSGGASQMRTIVTAFENGEDLNLSDPNEFNDIGAVTSVLKQYFRQLPNPLFTFDLYSKFLEALSLNSTEEKHEKFFQLLSQLPKENYVTLKYLMHHLYRVKSNASENLMTAKNLAVVFGPTLLRGPNANTEILDMNLKNSVVEYIIQNTERLFPQEVEQRLDGFI